MLTAEDARRLALALPEATELDHHGFPSFRVRGRIYATLPDPEHLRVFVDPDLVDHLIGTVEGDWCEPLWWGRRLRGITVFLPAADSDVVAEWLAGAWQRKAPARLSRQEPPG